MFSAASRFWSPASPRARGARALALLIVSLVVIGWLGLVTAPLSSAHSALRTSNPADGSVVAHLPPRAELVFNENIDPNFAQIVLADSAGTTSRLNEVAVRGPSVSVPLPRDLPAGKTALRYRVVSADSHPVSGEITFDYRPVAPSTPSETVPGSTSTPSQAPATGPAAQPAGDSGSGGATMMVALGGLGALIFGVIVFMLVRADRRR